MKFDYLVPGKILCELNELHLTCARIATEMDKRSWFLDLSISHIIHSIPHVRLKPKNKRIGQAYHGLITHDQLELKLDTLRSNWLFNGTRQQGEILILVLDSANEVKEVANDFKDRMHKKLITSSIPIVGAIACESSDPSEPNLEPTGNKAAALRDSQTNKTVSASQVNEDRSEHARDITVVHDSHGRADKEQVSEVEDPRDDGPCDNSGYTATSSRTRTQGDHGSISKDAKKQVRPPKAQPRKEIESLAQPNPSTTNRTAAQPLEDTYTQLYAQNDASHKAKPGKTYMSKGKDSDASAKKQTQATKTAAGKRKTRSAGQYKPGDAFSAVDALVRQKKQRIEPVANTMAAGVEVEEDIVASEVKTTKSSKTTTTTTSKTRRRLEREDQEFIEAQLDANNVPTQLPATNRGKKTGVREAGRVDNQKKASQAKQDQDTFSHIEQDGEDAAYADIDLLPQGPQLKPTKPGSKVAAKAARPTVSENKLMAEVIDLQTPDAKSVENFTTVVNYPVLALPDDRMNRKARIIEFGTRGPRNQGTESPDKTSEQKAPSMPQQSILEDAKPRPIPSHGARAPKAVLTPSHELTNVASNTQDEDIEEITVAPDPGHTAAVLDFSPEVSVIIDRTGSQLSQRVSGEGSPYSKNTRLPVARPRGSHGLNTSSDQVSNKDRAPTKVLEPAFEYVQLLKSSLPPSRNPDNDVDRPSRERTLAKAMAAATSAAPAFVVQPVRKLQGDQHSIAPLVETTKKAQSHTAGRMLPPQKLTKPSGTGTDNSDFSDVLAQSKAITTKSQPSIAGSLESSIKAKATSGTIPKKLAPDTPVPTLIVSKRSRVAPQASAKIGTQAQLHPRPVQFVKPVQGEFLTHPPAKQQTSRTVRGRLDQPNPQGDFIQTVLEPSTSTKVSQEEGRNAAARLQQDPTASSRPRTATKASVDMVNMLIERDAHENGAKSILILSPAPRLPTNIGLSSRAQEMPSSDIEQEISRPMDEESIPVPLEADPVPVPEVATDPVIPESKFTTLLKKRVFQEQLKPLLSEALHLHEDVEDSEQTLVEADGDTHILDEPAGDDQPEVGFENQESQEENKHESYDDVRMSDHSSNNSDRSSEVPERGAEEDEDEEGGDSDPEAREQEADAEYVAYQQQMAWQKALQPHQEEYHESFTSISMVSHSRSVLKHNG